MLVVDIERIMTMSSETPMEAFDRLMSEASYCLEFVKNGYYIEDEEPSTDEGEVSCQ